MPRGDVPRTARIVRRGYSEYSQTAKIRHDAVNTSHSYLWASTARARLLVLQRQRRPVSDDEMFRPFLFF